MGSENLAADRINIWTEEIDHVTEEFIRLCGSLSNDQLHRKPQPDKWSIAQIMDHLIVTNESYFPALSELKSGSYKLPITANFGFLVSLFGRLILKSVQPENKRKVKTFPVWQPAESRLPEDLPEKFEAHQEELKSRIRESGELLEKGTVISSPANRFIVYKLKTAYNIIVAHEKRHLEQAKEILQQIDNAI